MKIDPKTTPAEYIARGEKMLEFVRKFASLRSRIDRSMIYVREQEGDKFPDRRTKIDRTIATLWARCHFEQSEKVFEGRSTQMASIYGELFPMMERLWDVVK